MNIFRRNKDFLALDISDRVLTMAKFAYENNRIRLNDFKTVKLSSTVETDIAACGYERVSALREIVKCGSYRTNNVRLVTEDRIFFPRFVTLPPIASDKLLQIVKYEAEQNVPFPMDEVMWDYNLICSQPDKVSALIVAAKTERVEEFLNDVKAANLKIKTLEYKSLGTANLIRYNSASNNTDGSILVLDIGDASTSIIFIEKDKFFSRLIPIGYNAIISELAKEMNISYVEAEQIRAITNTVALTSLPPGVTTGTKTTAEISACIARNVLVRLHSETNRSINFYRSQQGGLSPSKVYVTGIGSKMSGILDLLAERLKLPILKLNPFESIDYSPLIAMNVSDYSYLLHGVVGLALSEYFPEMGNINLLKDKNKMVIKSRAKKFCVCDHCPFKK